MKVLVIIITYNGMQWMDRCLGSIRASSVPLDAYIVDNGSTDGTQEFIRTNYPEMIFEQSGENLGFGKANNKGLQYALDNNYDYVYLLNQDAWIFPNTIQALVGCHLKYPQYGVLSPFQLQANMKCLDVNFNQVCSTCSNFINDAYFNRIKEVYATDTVMAAHWLISRECLMKVGGFSPTFPHYGEDKNYTNRVYFHKLSVGIVPVAKAVHDRENRETTNARNIYIEYIGMLVCMSEIFNPQSHRFLRIFQRAIRIAIKYKSLIGFLNALKVILSFKSIIENMTRSKFPKAFLN